MNRTLSHLQGCRLSSKISECDGEIILEQAHVELAPHADGPRHKLPGDAYDDALVVLVHATVLRASHGTRHLQSRPAIGAGEVRDMLQVVDVAIERDLLA